MPRDVFVHQPTALARIPLRPADPLNQEHDSGLLAEGMFLASRAAGATHPEPAREARRAATWRAYDIRSRHRTTPHGVFAGAAPARFSDENTALGLGGGHRAVTTPSPAWLSAIADRLLDDPELLPRLRLTTNNLVVRRGDRWEADHPAPDRSVAQRSSVRATAVSTWLLDRCRRTRPAADVLAGLAARYPSAGQETLLGAVRQMVRAGLLLTDLLPPQLRDDPLSHLLDRLPPAATLRPDLEHLHLLLAQADQLTPGDRQRLVLLRAARDVMDGISVVERPLAVDTLADAALVLPVSIGAQAAQAASLLWRIGHLAEPLTDYHDRFVREFGRQRLVPLLEVIDPVTGIGPPSRSDDLGARNDLDSRRAEILTRLLADATAAGRREVTISDDLAEQLTRPAPDVPPRSAEIHVRIVRQEHGCLGIAVCDLGSQDAGAASGRFARWLPQLAPAPSAPTEALVAEIVCRPQVGAPAALTPETGFTTHRIPIGVPERDGDLTPDELMIATNGHHLLVWSPRHQRPVIPVLFSRLAPGLLPPAANLLRLAGYAGTRPWHPWSWGHGTTMPFTPRVRYRDVVLTPARWRLPEELAAAASRRSSWDRALDSWRNRVSPRLPRVAVVEESDRHIPLDLSRPDDRELLRRSVTRGARSLAEPLGSPHTTTTVVEGPNGRHLAELVVNLSRRDHPPARHPDTRSAPRRRSALHLPGGPWLSVALPVPAAHQDAVLRQLPEVFAPVDDHLDRWFWLRYHTPALGDHLRIRANGKPTDLNVHVLPQLTAWSAALNEQRLAGSLRLEPYEPETERYGGPAAISAAEDVFAADSILTSRLLALAPSPDDWPLLAALSSVDIARTLTRDPKRALRSAVLPPGERRTRDDLRVRLRAETTSLIPAALTGGWQARHTALTAYRATVSNPETSTACASDLIHMHCNRLLGTQPGSERIVRSLATDLLHFQAHETQH
ncbi:lantibiotic dehydratase [Streptomyces sp. NPDC059853]|uniref:lantibiotic dehydratase n=1 Tax=Streptomyces sp. NPDC059853 TaxID=3346973 RepID=UPI00365FD509